MSDTATPTPDPSAETPQAPTETPAASVPVEPVPAPAAEAAPSPEPWTLADVLRHLVNRHPWYCEADELAAIAAVEAWAATNPAL